LLTILALILTTASIPSEKAFDLRLSPFVDDLRFDWVGWETNAVLEEIDWRLRGRPIADDGRSDISLVEGRDKVLAFLDRGRSIAELENRIRDELALLPQPSPASRPRFWPTKA
jgi:hypothetical protein